MKKIARSLSFSFALSLLAASLPAAQPGSFHSDGSPQKQQIALTFDDGPGGTFTTKVLEVLDQHQVKATFFMNGDQVMIRPQIAKEVAAKGHEIADHTYSHANFYAYFKKNGMEKTREKALDEMKKSKAAIEKHLGVTPKLCRMPNGFHKPWMKEVAKEQGYALVNWTFGEDWLNIPQEKMTADYLKHVRPGAILLFHDGGNRREKTVAMLPLIIEEAKKKNLEIVTVGELLKD